ncbi:MAG: phosphocholine cytidylyltransferase family protein [bacterium]|nr:phosphocholine cytidylyltransferase family protein [bacterium]
MQDSCQLPLQRWPGPPPEKDLILSDSNHDNGHVTTALLLAAGTGSRLYPLTQSMPKCLTMVNGASILERLIICLNQHGFKRLVVVTGHLEHCIREFLGTQAGGMTVEYIPSPLYETTNNIYSLWMARERINEAFLLVESDLVFDVSLLDDMRYPDRIAVARMQPWMNGSTVTVNQFKQVKAFQSGTVGLSNEIRYKTVNIYSFSRSSWRAIAEGLDQHISAGRVHDYYETVLADMATDGSLSLQTVSFDGKPWYEIDTIADLSEAEKLFSADTYGTTIRDNITPQTLFQQTRSRQAGTITRPLSGVWSVPQPNSSTMKLIHGSAVQENGESSEKSNRN